MNPKYPIYVISKGRWESRMTVLALEAMRVPHLVVIEPQEREQYAKVIDPDRLLLLPHEGYGGGCSIPARNFLWEHSIKAGAERHWVLDDNIDGFYRFNRNIKVPVIDGTTFRCCEDFTDRYENVPMSGMNYFMFVSGRSSPPAYYLNTRIYSCILLRNDIYPEYAWRGRYNEDTDLSIRLLKRGYCTILFNAFIALKQTTGTVKGGNMTEIYGGDHLAGDNKAEKFREKRMLMAESLRDQHPDIVTITEKWGRPQHHVNYDGFTQKLIRKPGWNFSGVNNYGMEVKQVAQESKPKKTKAKKKEDAAESQFEIGMAEAEAEAKGEEYWKNYWAGRGEGNVKADFDNL